VLPLAVVCGLGLGFEGCCGLGIEDQVISLVLFGLGLQAFGVGFITSCTAAIKCLNLC